MELGITLEQTVTLAGHLVYWGKAQVVTKIRRTNVYRVGTLPAPPNPSSSPSPPRPLPVPSPSPPRLLAVSSPPPPPPPFSPPSFPVSFPVSSFPVSSFPVSFPVSSFPVSFPVFSPLLPRLGFRVQACHCLWWLRFVRNQRRVAPPQCPPTCYHACYHACNLTTPPPPQVTCSADLSPASAIARRFDSRFPDQQYCKALYRSRAVYVRCCLPRRGCGCASVVGGWGHILGGV
jgi:hypothetical protein